MNSDHMQVYKRSNAEGVPAPWVLATEQQQQQHSVEQDSPQQQTEVVPQNTMFEPCQRPYGKIGWCTKTNRHQGNCNTDGRSLTEETLEAKKKKTAPPGLECEKKRNCTRGYNHSGRCNNKRKSPENSNENALPHIQNRRKESPASRVTAIDLGLVEGETQDDIDSLIIHLVVKRCKGLMNRP